MLSKMVQLWQQDFMGIAFHTPHVKAILPDCDFVALFWALCYVCESAI